MNERTWTDEKGIVHALARVINRQGKLVKIVRVCTGHTIPLWGRLAENNTFDPATCLWCLAGELQPKEKE